MLERKNFGKLVEPIEPPNLIEIQTDPYVDFLQKDVDPDKRKAVGLQGVFKEVFPIESYDGQVKLDFVRYTISEPKLDALECQRGGRNILSGICTWFSVSNAKVAVGWKRACTWAKSRS